MDTWYRETVSFVSRTRGLFQKRRTKRDRHYTADRAMKRSSLDEERRQKVDHRRQAFRSLPGRMKSRIFLQPVNQVSSCHCVSSRVSGIPIVNFSPPWNLIPCLFSSPSPSVLCLCRALPRINFSQESRRNVNSIVLLQSALNSLM